MDELCRVALEDPDEGVRELAEVLLQEHLAKTLAVGCGGVVRTACGVRPAHPDELVDEGLFDLGEFGACAHRRLSSCCCILYEDGVQNVVTESLDTGEVMESVLVGCSQGFRRLIQ